MGTLLARGFGVLVVVLTALLPATPAGAQLNVTVSAASAFFDTTNTIPVTAMEWTASGDASFVGGQMNTAEQTVAQWNGPGAQNGTQNYTLVNSWDYAPGTHQVQLTYTLSTP